MPRAMALAAAGEGVPRITMWETELCTSERAMGRYGTDIERSHHPHPPSCPCWSSLGLTLLDASRSWSLPTPTQSTRPTPTENPPPTPTPPPRWSAQWPVTRRKINEVVPACNFFAPVLGDGLLSTMIVLRLTAAADFRLAVLRGHLGEPL
mmetsp:Transcript_46986/g.91716  ORF Transcript_46986/g.91716 Transcript_46986/m.91716 type:complete len:151 (-) Transcript_46986:147-599(-)